MHIRLLRETVLETKLGLLRAFRQKNESVKAHRFEEAAEYRSAERALLEKIDQLRHETINLLEDCKKSPEDLEHYIELQTILFEFHPMDFYKSSRYDINEEAVKKYLSDYWEQRNQINRDIFLCLKKEYEMIRDAMHQFKNEGDDEKAKKALLRLKDIGDIIQSYQP